MHDSAHAEDLVQDTLIAVVQQCASYRGDAALSTWAISILRHKVADWYRSPTAKRETQLPDAGEAAIESDEIRAQLGLSADNVRTILHRARLSLRECMQRHWFSASKNTART